MPSQLDPQEIEEKEEKNKEKKKRILRESDNSSITFTRPYEYNYKLPDSF